jgi:hypothetical protein
MCYSRDLLSERSAEAGSEEEEDERRGSLPNSGSRRGSKLAEILKYQVSPHFVEGETPGLSWLFTLLYNGASAVLYHHKLSTNLPTLLILPYNFSCMYCFKLLSIFVVTFKHFNEF